MIDPTRLAAIKALQSTPGPYLREGGTVYSLGELTNSWLNGKPIEANRIYFHVSATRGLTPDGEAEAASV